MRQLTRGLRAGIAHADLTQAYPHQGFAYARSSLPPSCHEYGGFGHAGWWLSHPSEKYEVVSWDDYSQSMGP